MSSLEVVVTFYNESGSRNPNPWQASGRAIGTLMDYLKQHLPFSVTSSLNTSYFPSPILHHRKMSQEGFRTI
jgi:hypothetical protein